jgi:hypothetical protein
MARLAMKADPGAKAALGRNLRCAPRERDMSRAQFRVAGGKSAEEPARMRDSRAALRRLEDAKYLRGAVPEWLRTSIYGGSGVASVRDLTAEQAVEAWSAWQDRVDEKVGATRFRVPPGITATTHANATASSPA